MSDTQPNQAMPGNDGHKGENTGIDHPSGKHGGSESSGAAYPNPQTGSKGDNSGFFGHGGQTHIAYSGPGATGDPSEGNENAATGAKVKE